MRWLKQCLNPYPGSDADFEAAGKGRSLQLLLGNYELLRRAVENVVRNAVRYTVSETVMEVHQEHTAAAIVSAVTIYCLHGFSAVY